MELREAPCVVDLDETDTSLVRLLQTDGRMSYATIARRLGLAQATVRKRVNRLVKNGVVRLRAVVNPTKVGYPLLIHIGMQVDLDKLEKVAASLAALQEVRSVYYSTGMYDVVITAVFPSTDGLLEFLHKKLGAIEGIKRAGPPAANQSTALDYPLRFPLSQFLCRVAQQPAEDFLIVRAWRRNGGDLAQLRAGELDRRAGNRHRPGRRVLRLNHHLVGPRVR